MNNGVNNSELKIEPVQSEQPKENIQPTEPKSEPAQPKAEEQQSLGSNVKIAPVQPMYDENGKVIQQPEPVAPKKAPEPPRPEITQPTPTVPGEPPQIQIKEEEKKELQAVESQAAEQPKPKKKLSMTPLFLIIIVALIGGIIYINNDKESTIKQLKNQNIVIDTNDEKIQLDKNSTLVQDLYNKVVTTVKEDWANPNLDDEMKRYLAFRQLNSNMFYDSHCNLFDQNKIYNYTCDDKDFKPKAFKEEMLKLELKKMFGENSQIETGNIQLGRQCIGGYEYIPERGEYVQGKCIENLAITINVKKEIVEAYRINDEVYIVEETKYISGNKGDIPETLKDGLYTHTFKLDTNLNYAYISKTYKPKY